MKTLFTSPRARTATVPPPHLHPVDIEQGLPPCAAGLPPSRRGAALLIVIGLLSLLLISAVAFSILMTVERSAAGNYRHAVQARQLLYAGLAQAIADLNTNVGDNCYPPWTNGVITVGNRHTACNMDVMQSIDYLRNQTNDVCAARVLSAEALKYIPRSLWHAVQTVTPEALSFSVNGSPVGRYAYVAVNVSGLLDANQICTTSRWVGADAGEIQIANGLPFDVTNAAGFAIDRTTDQRYESTSDLAQWNSGVNSNTLSNFETYSYSPTPELQPDRVTPKVYIGFDPTIPGTAVQQLQAQQTAISNAFYQCLTNSTPIPATNTATSAQWAYESLIDYVSTDPVPDGCDRAFANIQAELARPASKNAPMIESVSLAMTYNWVYLSATTFSYSVSYMPVVSCARPFVGPSPLATYNVQLKLIVNPSSDPSLTKYNVLLPTSLAASQAATVTFAANTYNSARFAAFPVVTTPTLILTNTVASFIQPTNACMLAFAVRITDVSGNIVDQVPAGTTSIGGSGFADLMHYIVFYYRHACGGKPLPAVAGPYPSPTNSENHVVWAEAIDPAINWNGVTDLTGSGQWIASETDGGVNGDPNIPPRFALTNLLTTFPSFFSSATTVGVTRTTSASRTWTSKVQQNACGGLLSSCLLTNGNNSSMLAWWNLNARTQWGRGNFAPCIVPDGLTLGASAADPLNYQIRHYIKGGAITNVGELGYLPIGPWMTFNLYPHEHNSVVQNGKTMLPSDSQYHRLLDYFTVRPTNTVSKVRGLVNLATPNPNVHACVFYQMPINDFDQGTAPIKTVNLANDAVSLANLMTANSYAITTLSDIGLLLSGAQTSGIFSSITAFPPATTGEFERKAIIRNAAGLYTMRQQLYTIIVRADAMSQGYGGVIQGQGQGSSTSSNPALSGSVLGSTLGVFQVWRDPEPDADGKHPCFVRLCKILSL